MNLVWWIPTEFWSATLLSNKDLPPEASKEVIDKLKPYAILAVVRGDITNAKFYDKATVQANLTVTYKDAKGKTFVLKPIENPNDTVTQLINQIKPMLTAAMGKTGLNMHFYVFDDQAAGQRIVPLTEHGQLIVELKPLPKEDGGTIAFDLPLDSLFQPRLCANCGHKANVSWLYCPYCGKELAK
jgi:hypothetical protein